MTKPYRLEKNFYDSVCQHLSALNSNAKLDTHERLIALNIQQRNDEQGIGSFITTAIAAVAAIVATLALVYSGDFLDPKTILPVWVVVVFFVSVYVVLIFVVIQALVSRHKNKKRAPMEASLAIIQQRQNHPVSNSGGRGRAWKASPSRSNYLTLGVLAGIIVENARGRTSK